MINQDWDRILECASMTRVCLVQGAPGGDELAFRAVTVRKQAAGRTAGEALDALTSQLTADEVDTLIVVRNMAPDQFFTASQRQRLEQLMATWRSARDAGENLPPEELSELEGLIDAETHAAADRAMALGRELGS
jgi:hypothetical protein